MLLLLTQVTGLPEHLHDGGVPGGRLEPPRSRGVGGRLSHGQGVLRERQPALVGTPSGAGSW
ncbi:hypothetical protein [Streptomyces werraensis]|uniref:hypothetical protein n=1 Tax=Streptomyces werraensis TaxID=68284 RepID=UPI0033AD9957